MHKLMSLRKGQRDVWARAHTRTEADYGLFRTAKERKGSMTPELLSGGKEVEKTLPSFSLASCLGEENLSPKGLKGGRKEVLFILY